MRASATPRRTTTSGGNEISWLIEFKRASERASLLVIAQVFSLMRSTPPPLEKLNLSELEEN